MSLVNALFSVSHLSTILNNLSSRFWFTFWTRLWASCNLAYFSCQIKSSSLVEASSPFGNFSASFKNCVSIVAMWLSLSISRWRKFSISTCRCMSSCSWSFLAQLAHLQPHSWKRSAVTYGGEVRSQTVEKVTDRQIKLQSLWISQRTHTIHPFHWIFTYEWRTYLTFLSHRAARGLCLKRWKNIDEYRDLEIGAS